jgi:hypothetical protein
VLGGGAAEEEMAPAWHRLGGFEVTVVEAAERLLTRGEPFTGDMACGFLGLQYAPPDRRVIAPDAARRWLRPVVAPEPPDAPITRIDNPILKETNQ